MNKIKRIDLFLIIVVLIITMSFILIKVFSYRSGPFILSYVENKAINIMNTLINKSIKESLKYDKIIEIDKNSNGDIVSLNFNSNEVNKILLMTNEKLIEDLDLLEKGKYKDLNVNYLDSFNNIYYIPFNVIHNTPILVNIGPKIPFKIEMIGNVNNEITNNIREYGINSSIIEVILNINFQIQVIIPFKSKVIDINKKIILDSKIIQGNIPNYYGNLYPGTLK